VQSVHDVTISDLIIYPSLSGTVVTDDLVRLDENDTNVTFNTITFENCIITEIDTAGAPLVTTMTNAATDVVPVTVGSSRSGYAYLFQWWGDTGESQHVAVTDCAVFCNPQSYMIRLAGDGADGETCTWTDCITRGGGYCNIRGSASNATVYTFTGTDQTEGWQNCFYNTDPISGHGVYFSASSGGGSGLIEKMIIRTTDRAISGNAGLDMDLADCIMEYTAPAVVDGPANASTWTRCTFDGQDAGVVYYGVGGAGSITVRDCIFSNNVGGFDPTGTMPAGGIDVDYCALVSSGPDANSGDPLTDWAVTGVTIGANCIDADPLYLGKNPELSTHYDVDNGSAAPAGYLGAGTGASNLAGGADFVGGSTVIDWSVY
jgi:hypothetical protein